MTKKGGTGMEFVMYEKRNDYAVVTINRPSALNALNSRVLEELEAVFDSIDTDEVRAVVLTGAGEKSFVAGADIGVATTGIAGPDGGTEEKHVGLVFIGLSFGDQCICRKIDRRIKERQRNRRHAVLSMFDMIYRNVQ